MQHQPVYAAAFEPMKLPIKDDTLLLRIATIVLEATGANAGRQARDTGVSATALRRRR